MADTHADNATHRLQALRGALDSGTSHHVRRLLHSLHPAEIALLLESLPAHERAISWKLTHKDDVGDILAHVNDEVRASLISQMENNDLVAATEGMDLDDLADIMADLPKQVRQKLLQSLDHQNRQFLQQVLSFPEDSAGGLMNPDTVTVRPDIDVDVVLRYLRLRGELPQHTDKLFVMTRGGVCVGALPLTLVLTAKPETSVAELMDREVKTIRVDQDSHTVAQLFEDRDLISAAVVDEQGKLLGRITIDDVVDVIREEAEHSILSMAGLDEDDDIFAPVITSARRRAVWLGVNLLTAFMAAWVVGLFEGTIQQIAALAVLMPIVASMGGIAGSQTLTIMIRGLVLGQISGSTAGLVLRKEVAVALLNGILWAAVVAAVTAWVFNNQLAMVIGVAMVINMVCGVIAGVAVPLLVRMLKIDPALAGSVVLTTVTDVIGFFALLGLGTIVLL